MRQPSGSPPAIDDEPTAIHMRSGGVTTPLVGAAAAPLGQARPTAAAAARTTPSPSSSEAGAELRAYQAPLAGFGNPYLAAAAPLLDLIVEIHATQAHPDVAGLRAQITEQVRGFERRALEAGAVPDYVQAARYALCSALDEAVLTTDWGAESAWSQQSLLSQFHNDVWGGEKVFEMLDELRRTPRGATDVVELIAFLIGLGFEGRYRVMSGGGAQLEDLRREVFRQIRIERTQRPTDLSNGNHGRVAGGGLRRYVPVWVVAAACALILTLSFFYFEEKFHTKLQPLLGRLDALIHDPMNATGGGG